VHTATEFVQRVENVLGWTPAGSGWKARTVEAAKVNKRISEDPALYSWVHLELAVELMRRERRCVAPLTVMSHVKRALELAPVTERADAIDAQIQEIASVQRAKGDPGGWADRLLRARGAGRQRALDDFAAARRLGVV